MAMRILSLLVLLLAAGSAVGRPCKIIFYFTATTYYPYDSLSGNPNPNPFFQNPSYLPLIFTTTTTSSTPRFSDHLPSFNFNSEDTVGDDSESTSMITSSDLPLRFYSSVSDSIRQRSRDIMSVVGALLFGVAFGALTAATMYFVWALFAPRHFDFEDVSSSDDDDDEDDDDDDVSASKQLGYVAIPAKPKVVDDDLKKPPAMATEAV